MDAIGFFLTRYGDLHGGLVEGLLAKLPEAQLRARPHPGVNTVAWLVWHSARIEDLAVNRFLSDRRQVLDEGWLERLAVPRRDVGTGMTDAQVDEFSAGIDLQALKVGTSSSSLVLTPNPMRASGSVFHLDTSDGVAFARSPFQIRDVRGRVVAELRTDAQGKASWNGTDRNGRRCPAGVYFVRVIQYGVAGVPEPLAQARMVLLP